MFKSSCVPTASTKWFHQNRNELAARPSGKPVNQAITPIGTRDEGFGIAFGWRMKKVFFALCYAAFARRLESSYIVRRSVRVRTLSAPCSFGISSSRRCACA
jgi:hypothetical protein